jgi:predicted histidine transporter YuiF (NhaC family)
VNPLIKKAYEWAPTLRNSEKIGKIIIILAILILLILSNRDKISKYNEEMSQKQGKYEDGQWEDSESQQNWFIALIIGVISQNISWFAFKEMSFYVGLSVFSIIGFGMLNYYNVKHDQKIEDEQKKMFEEKRKIKPKSKFAKKKN